MAKILILLGGHLCNAPRPQKEADTLAQAGHEVTVAGFFFDPEFVKRDCLLLQTKPWQFHPIVDFQPHHRLTNLWIRTQGRIAKECYRRFQTFSPNLLGFSARAMLKLARQTQADLTIVHSELGLWVGNQCLNEGLRVGVDFEDWFSEDLLPEACLTRPIVQLKALEQRLIRECQYCLTTSNALAEAMAKAYQAPKPTVIYNSFPWSERETIDGKMYDRQNPRIPSVHWFSQTIGPGRGLETLFEALPYLQDPIEIHLRGHYPESSHQWLESLLPSEWYNRIFIHPTVSNGELLSRIAEHDIGLALEIPYCLSRQFTITNKLFQYLQAGLAVVATNTVGQQEVFSKFPGTGRLIPNRNPEALAHALKELVTQPNTLADAKQKVLHAAQTDYCWEQQANKVVAVAASALH